MKLLSSKALCVRENDDKLRLGLTSEFGLGKRLVRYAKVMVLLTRGNVQQGVAYTRCGPIGGHMGHVPLPDSTCLNVIWSVCTNMLTIPIP